MSLLASYLALARTPWPKKSVCCVKSLTCLGCCNLQDMSNSILFPSPPGSLNAAAGVTGTLHLYVRQYAHHHHYHHLSLNREGHWGITDDFTTSFLHFFLLLPLFHCALQDDFGQSWWTGDMTIPLQFVSLRWSGGLRVVRLPAASWHGFPRW